MTEELAHRSVLVAGESDDAASLAALLRAAGTDAHVVSTAESARRYLDRHHVDLVVADVDLEESCAGFDLAMALRMDPARRRTRVVLTSAIPATCSLLANIPVSCLPCDRFLSRKAGHLAMVEAVEELLDGQPTSGRAAVGSGGSGRSGR